MKNIIKTEKLLEKLYKIMKY